MCVFIKKKKERGRQKGNKIKKERSLVQYYGEMDTYTSEGKQKKING